MQNGYIKFFRNIPSWQWYKNPNTARLYFHCLVMANWKDKEYKGELIPTGSFVTGRKKLAYELGLTDNQVRTALNNLKSTNDITIKSTKKYSVITVVNYDKYQVNNQEYNQEYNQQLHQQLTTNEEYKNKEEKNILSNISNDILDCPSESQRNDSYSWLIDAWNTLTDFGIAPVKRITEGSKRISNVRARIKQYGKESMLEAIENIKHSDFLQGKHKGGSWQITFDWFILPSNFPKVLEGNYNNDGDGRTEKQDNKYSDYAKDLYSKLGIDV
jgi:NCAIR mutase (PurE)-related protein